MAGPDFLWKRVVLQSPSPASFFLDCWVESNRNGKGSFNGKGLVSIYVKHFLFKVMFERTFNLGILNRQMSNTVSKYGFLVRWFRIFMIRFLIRSQLRNRNFTLRRTKIDLSLKIKRTIKTKISWVSHIKSHVRFHNNPDLFPSSTFHLLNGRNYLVLKIEWSIEIRVFWSLISNVSDFWCGPEVPPNSLLCSSMTEIISSLNSEQIGMGAEGGG